MDRNTIIGLVIIGLILSVFTILRQPSEEEIKAQKEKQKIEQEKAEEKLAKKEGDEKVKDSTLVSHLVPKLDKDGNAAPADSGMGMYTDTITGLDTMLVADKTIEEPKATKVEENTSEGK